MNDSQVVLAGEKPTGELVNLHDDSMHPMVAMAMGQGEFAIDKLEKLMDLQERWEVSQAKKAFSAAMADFQANIPEIKKTKSGHNCKYADIDDIAQAIKPVLMKTGLSYRFEQSQNENHIKVECVVTHTSGHQESAEMFSPADTSGGKNDIQSIASAVTYLRRYTLTAVMGITTGMEVDDGGKPAIDLDHLLNHNKFVLQEFLSIAAVKEALGNEDYSAAKEAWNEVDKNVIGQIWRAPTKGGMFTTKERAQMQSNEWSAA